MEVLELKRAGKIQSYWSAKSVVKIKRTMYERSIAITHDTESASLYPDFVFKERTLLALSSSLHNGI